MRSLQSKLVRCCRTKIQAWKLGRLRGVVTAAGWNPASNPAPIGAPWLNQVSAKGAFPPFKRDFIEWLDETGQDLGHIQKSFQEHGFAVLENIIPPESLSAYDAFHESIICGELLTPGRHDLGSHKTEKISGVENVGQIMWPSDIVEGMRDGPLHIRSCQIARHLLGDDLSFDFDMLIFKEPNTATETPWHQDEAYWPDGMTDKRAITIWCALDEARIDNGAMWFVSGSHLGELHPHKSAADGSHILMTEAASESSPGSQCVELRPGSAVIWHGRTLHYSRGNSTMQRRRTLITNYRPEAMVKWERENGFDHLRKGMDDYDCQMEAARGT